MKKIKIIIVVSVVLVIIASVFAYFNHYLFIYKVDSNQHGVEKFLGKYSRTTGPGLHFKFPHPITTVDIVNSAKIRQINLGLKKVESDSAQVSPSETLIFTSDEKVVNLAVVVQYKIENPKKYILSIAENEKIIENACKAVVKSVVGRHTIDEILTTGKPKIEKEIKDEINALWQKYSAGLELLSVNLQKSSPPNEVLGAFKTVTDAKENKNTLINKAIAEGENKIILARAEASKIVEQAKTYYIRRTKRAKGEAEAFNLIHSEYSKNRELVRRMLYLEMLETILPGVKVYVMDANGNVNILNLNK